MATEVERILQSRQRRLRKWMPYCTFLGSVVLTAAAAAWGRAHPWLFSDETTTPSPLGSSILAGLMAAGFSAMPLIGMASWPKSSAIVHTRTHEQAPPWAKRNKDALVTNAIVSSVFLILGIVIGYVLPR